VQLDEIAKHVGASASDIAELKQTAASIRRLVIQGAFLAVLAVLTSLANLTVRYLDAQLQTVPAPGGATGSKGEGHGQQKSVSDAGAP
jgi:hypothetical protein